MRTLLPLVLLGVAACVPAVAAPGPLPPEMQMEGSETIAAPPDARLQDARWCRLCHQAERFERSAWRSTAHHEQTCTDCHTGYHFNPHEPVELGPGADTEEGATPAARRAAARERCRECHGEELPTSGDIEHGPGTEGAVTPQCHDCHGDPHTIVTEASLPAPERRRRMNGRCATCHGDEAKMKAVGLNTHSVESYAHSVHARLLDLGSDDAPGCVDCHQAHTLRDFEADGVAACEQCHVHATAEFVTLGDHRPYTREDRPVSFFTLKFFAWLTFLSVFALAMHVLLDVFSTVRRALFGGKRTSPTERAGGDEA